MKLENKLLEQRILINNCLAPFDFEFKHMNFGGYPFLFPLAVSAKYVLAVHFKYFQKCLVAWFLETDDVSINF